MKAVLVREGGALSYEDFDDPVAGPGEVVVELRGGGQPPRPARPEPARPGVPVSAAADPGLGRGRHSARHGRGGRHLPGARLGAAGGRGRADWRILGGPDNGTYAELVKVPEENVFPKPARFSWEEAAAFPLAGADRLPGALRGRRADRRTRRVLVLGAGSGVSTFAVSLAVQAGARVLVTSSSQEKIERAKELGADGGVLYTEEGWPEAAARWTSCSTRSGRRGATR